MLTDLDPAQAKAIESSVSRAADALWNQQRPDGSWEGYLASSALATGAALLALVFGDRAGSEETIERGAAWLVADQNPDGGWSDSTGAQSTLNSTATALSALTLARPDATREIERGKKAIERFGGVRAIEDPEIATLGLTVRLALGLAGHYDADRVPRVPLAVALLPERVQQQVSFLRPMIYALGLKDRHTRPGGPIRRFVESRAERRVMDWLHEVRRLEGPDGAYMDAPAALSWIVVGLALAGTGDDIVKHYCAYLRSIVRPDGSWAGVRDLELSGTGYVADGLCEAGFGADPRFQATADWVRRAQRTTPISFTGCPAGGWGWSSPSSWPDVDDTSLATRLVARSTTEPDDHARAGLAWLQAMQSRNGSWSSFVRNGRTKFDAPCSALTAQAMLALHALGDRSSRLDRAAKWLSEAQRPDGALPAVWFRNWTAGTAFGLKALGTVGMGDQPTARGCLKWLSEHQSRDGGWGDGAGAPSTAEETAWALLGVSTVAPRSETAHAGARWLMSHQQADGLWAPSPVSYYNQRVTYWCDGMVNGFALQALARYRNGRP
ncbi:prenyltransferase/squalene oxidase repeat-containing protein [Amycolatopsis japonica]